MRVFRFDRGGEVLAKPRKLRGGGIRVDGFFTKPGVFPYLDAGTGKTVMEWRPSEEVFAQASLESWKGVPVTDGHPPDLVTDETWSRHAVGALGDDVRVEGDKAAASHIIRRADAVKAVMSGARAELSGGYWCDIDETPGSTPEGIRYDRVQRSIEGNHVAILPRNEARLGRDMTMRLDSQGHQCFPPQRQLRLDHEDIPMKIRFDGKSYDLSDEKDTSRLEDALVATEKATEEGKIAVAKLQGERDEAVKRADAAEAASKAQLAELPKLVEMGVAEGVKARTDRIALEGRAREVLGAEVGSKVDGKTDDEVRAAIRAGMEAAIKEADPEAVFDGLSDEYVRGRYDVARKPREDGARHDPSLESVRVAAVQAPRSAAAMGRTDIGSAFRGAQQAVQDAK